MYSMSNSNTRLNEAKCQILIQMEILILKSVKLIN